jgi:hypothetical protein
VTSVICTCAEFDCEPDVPVTTATPFGFACDDLQPGDPLYPSCRQYERVKVLEAEVARLKSMAVCPRPCCAPDRKWIGAHGLEIQAGRR